MPAENTPIKIAYVIGGLPFGGVENWLLDLMLNLRGDPSVTPFVINVSGTGQLMPRYEECGIEVICIGNDKAAIKTHRIDTVLALRKVLKSLQVDVIHTLHFSGDFFGRLASIGLGVPVITHIRNIKSETKARRRFFNKLLSWKTTKYLSVSKAAAETIEREHNAAKRPVEVVYNAVNPAKLDVEAFDLKEKHNITGRVVIGVGRLVKQKNFDLLIRAIEKVRREVDDVSLLILGDGGEMPALRELRAELGLEDAVHLVGYVPNADVPKYLRASHILAMPSDYEGLPITHVEALFCGLPAVISEFVPSKEVAADSSLICKTETDDIAAKLIQLLNDEELYQDMSRRALSTAPRFSMENYLKRLKGIYREILG
jgi:glycosyltransferase involved in cell wall biosynthesis